MIFAMLLLAMLLPFATPPRHAIAAARYSDNIETPAVTRHILRYFRRYYIRYARDALMLVYARRRLLMRQRLRYDPEYGALLPPA